MKLTKISSMIGSIFYGIKKNKKILKEKILQIKQKFIIANKKYLIPGIIILVCSILSLVWSIHKVNADTKPAECVSYDNTSSGLKATNVQDEDGKEFIKNFKIYEFNMEFYKKIWLNKNISQIEDNKHIIMLDLELEDLNKLSKGNKMVNKYMKNLEEINKEPEFREYMSAEEDARKIHNSLVKETKELKQQIKESEK